MSTRLIQLYPHPGQEQVLQGLYLEHRLHELGTAASPFVYANFVSSLDGRIALIDPASGDSFIPDTLTSPSDWRLFQELQAQADCFITHGAYLRAVADGRLKDILQVGVRDNSEDLAAWRHSQRLSTQPAVVVASSSLVFPIPDSVRAHQQTLYIATGERADPSRIRYWERQRYPVIRAGNGVMAEGVPLVRALGKLGYRSLYLIAGPLMLATMLRDGRLDRL